MRNFVVWNSITTHYGSGSWALIDNMVTVRTAYGTKSTQHGGMDPETLARKLMRELAVENGARERDFAS